jgi:hypothetical protein
MDRDPRPAAPVRPKQRLTASLWNRAIEAVRDRFIIPVVPLHLDEATGILTLDDIPEEWAGVVSITAGVYTLQVLVAAPGGGWTNAPYTIKAREVNANLTVPAGTKVRAKFDRAANYWYFIASKCT